jgi:DNA polymerase III subunit delta'
MHQIIELYKQKQVLHHAYLYVGHEMHEMIAHLKHFLENIMLVKTNGNPDFQHKKYETFTIEDARVLADSENRKNISGGKKIFIIETDFMTLEAQNSLLKIFEEPTEGTHFFVVTPQDILLPTLRSRMQVIFHEAGEEKQKSILKQSVAERLAIVKELTDSISDEEKTKQDAISLLNKIEKELHDGGVEKNAKSLEVCELSRKALYDRGAPVKMILENLMLSI